MNLARFLLADGEPPSLQGAARACGTAARYAVRTLRDRSGQAPDQRAYCAVDHAELSEISARPCHWELWPGELAEEVGEAGGVAMDSYGVRFEWIEVVEELEDGEGEGEGGCELPAVPGDPVHAGGPGGGRVAGELPALPAAGALLDAPGLRGDRDGPDVDRPDRGLGDARPGPEVEPAGTNRAPALGAPVGGDPRVPAVGPVKAVARPQAFAWGD